MKNILIVSILLSCVYCQTNSDGSLFTLKQFYTTDVELTKSNIPYILEQETLRYNTQRVSLVSSLIAGMSGLVVGAIGIGTEDKNMIMFGTLAGGMFMPVSIMMHQASQETKTRIILLKKQF